MSSCFGVLFDELERRGVLGKTWLFIVSDHGESFGEHASVFCHGTSLYQTEVHVPLLIIPPGGSPTPQVVSETVSLRDLPATVADILGMTADSPFPGDYASWFASGQRAVGWSSPSDQASSHQGLAEVVPTDPSNWDASGLPKKTWPLAALADGEWSYIRREGDVREELFHVRDDKNEQRNLADDPAARPRLERMRNNLGQLTAGPLLPDRLSP